MKFFPFVIVFLFSSFMMLAQNSVELVQNSVKLDVNNIEVYFHSKLKSEDLIEIQKQMSQLGIQLVYTELAFQEDGRLKKISFKVDCNDGFSGSASGNVKSLSNGVGFYRNYQPGVKSAFGTGTSRK